MDRTQTSPHTLVVSLDAPTVRFVPGSPARILRDFGHDVTAVGYDLSESCPRADVVVVVASDDLELGRDAIKRLRQRSDFLESRFLLCIDVLRLSGLDPEIGADDFILTPIDTQELRARVSYLLWRDKRPGKALQIRYGEITLDCEMRQAYGASGTLGLTLVEFQLFRFMVERAGRVYTRSELLSRVLGYQRSGGSRTVDTHVLNLRTKLGEIGSRIVCVRGVGYKLERAEASILGAAHGDARVSGRLMRGADAAARRAVKLS